MELHFDLHGQMATHLDASKIWDSNKRTRNRAAGGEGDGKDFNGLGIGREVGRVTNEKRHRLKLYRVVVRELGDLVVNIVNRRLVSLGANDTILIWRLVCKILEDLGLLAQSVGVNCFAQFFLCIPTLAFFGLLECN